MQRSTPFLIASVSHMDHGIAKLYGGASSGSPQLLTRWSVSVLKVGVVVTD